MPNFCQPEMYEIMLSCWKKVPEERPTFEYLFNTMDDYHIAVAGQYAQTNNNCASIDAERLCALLESIIENYSDADIHLCT